MKAVLVEGGARGKGKEKKRKEFSFLFIPVIKTLSSVHLGKFPINRLTEKNIPTTVQTAASEESVFRNTVFF